MLKWLIQDEQLVVHLATKVRTSRGSTQPSESKTTLNATSADRNKLIAQREYRGMNYSRTRSGSQYKPADIEVGNYYLSDRDYAIISTQRGQT